MKIEFEKYIKDTLEVKQMQNAYEFIFGMIEEEFEKAINNQSFDDMDIQMVRGWEEALNIAKDETKDIGTRKMEIKSLLLTQIPYTKNSIKEQLQGITGKEISVTDDNDRLVIDLSGIDSSLISVVKKYIKGVKPLNVYDVIKMANDIENSHRMYQIMSRVIKMEVGA